MKNLLSFIFLLLFVSLTSNVFGQSTKKVQAPVAKSVIIGDKGTTNAIGYFEKIDDENWSSTINSLKKSYTFISQDQWTIVLKATDAEQLISLNLWLEKVNYDGVQKYSILESRSGPVPAQHLSSSSPGNINKRITTSATTGTVILHNKGGYILEVFQGDSGESGTKVGRLLVNNELPLPNMPKGTYISFKPVETSDNVRTEPVFLWNVDNHDYFIYSQANSDPKTNAFPIGPNLYGIDLTTLDPRNIAGSQTSGQIFEGMESYSVDYTTVSGADGEYIKEGFQRTTTNTGKGDNSQKMRYKAESVKNSWSINVDLSGSVPLKSGGKVDAGVGVGYNEFDETNKHRKEIFIEQSEWKDKYTIECDSAKADLLKDFRVAARNLPEVYNPQTKDAFRQFVDYYGTHFLSEITYGGFYNSYLAMSESTFNSLQGNALNVKGDIAISKGGNTQTAATYASNPGTGNENGLETSREVTTNSNNSKGGKLSVSYSKKHEKELNKAFQEMEGGFEYGGGDGNFDVWDVSQEDAVPIIIKPQLISELLKPVSFKDDTDPDKLRNIKASLELYLVDYIATMPPKNLLDAPPIGYNLEITEVKITNYKDEVDATKKADISLMAYSGSLTTLKAKNPKTSYRNGEVEKPIVSEANINPDQKLNKPLDIISNEIGLIVKSGNPEKRVFKIVGTFKEYDSNFGGTPEEWVASAFINTDLTDTNPTRNGELNLTHSAVRWGSKQQFDVKIKYKLSRNNDIFDIPEGGQVKLSNQPEQVPTNELVTDVALNEAKKITFRHKGAYIAKYSIQYTHNGRQETISTGEVTSVSEGSYKIPFGATNVKVSAEGLTGLVWAPITVHFQQTYPTAVSRIIESYGSTLDQSYKELNESGGVISQGSAPPPPSNEKRITLKNRGAYNAKYTITYTLKGQGKSESTGELLSGQDKSFDISADATNVSITAQGATGLVWEPWSTHFKQTYAKIDDRTIESYGTTLNQSYKELNKNGGIVSQGNTPPPPADNVRITFKNRAAFTARYTLHYTLQGQRVTLSSGDITTGRDKLFDVPRVATNVYLKAEGHTGLAWEPWRKHLEKTIQSPTNKTIESNGTTLNQIAKEY